MSPAPASSSVTRIGVLSDTHGFLDPKIARLFAGVDGILHAGDVGSARVLHELRRIAPVTAVLGNTDVGLDLRETEVVRVGERKFLVHHIVDPLALGERVRRTIGNERPDVVVFGHTHRPFRQTVGGRLFLNPGYCGRQRFRLERSVVVLACSGSEVTVEFVPLEERGTNV